MSDQKGHPVPPHEIVEEWHSLIAGDPCPVESATSSIALIAHKAAKWGADQELEACCRWLAQEKSYGASTTKAIMDLRVARRPNLKWRALDQLNALHAELKRHGMGTNTDTIRRALEALDD